MECHASLTSQATHLGLVCLLQPFDDTRLPSAKRVCQIGGQELRSQLRDSQKKKKGKQGSNNHLADTDVFTWSTISEVAASVQLCQACTSQFMRHCPLQTATSAPRCPTQHERRCHFRRLALPELHWLLSGTMRFCHTQSCCCTELAQLTVVTHDNVACHVATDDNVPTYDHAQAMLLCALHVARAADKDNRDAALKILECWTH